MFTIQYKGHFIHGYCHKSECKFHAEFEVTQWCKSVHAAKVRITRKITKAAQA